MKKLFPLFILALVVLIGCAKEEKTIPAALSTDDQLEIQLDQSIYYLDFNSPNQELQELSFEGLDFDQLNLTSNVATTRANPNTSANGHVTTPNGTDIVFSAMENNGGIHGQLNIFGDIIDLHADVICIYVVDNQAYIGAIITQSTLGPPVGWYVYFGVEDNGEGNNAAADRVVLAPLVSPVEISFEGCGCPFEALQGCEAAAFIYANFFPLPHGVEDAFVDGIDPTQVQVN